MADHVTCPFMTCGKHQITRPGFFDHLFSRQHREELRSALRQRSKAFLRPDSRSLPYIETKTGFVSFCLGCRKAYTSTKSDHFDTCSKRQDHLAQLEKLLGVTDTSVEDGAAADPFEVDALKKRIAELERQLADQKASYEKKLKKAQDEFEAFEEVAQEDADNAQKYHTLLGVIVGQKDSNTADFEALAEKIKKGEEKSHYELSQTPPSAPSAPAPTAAPTAVATAPVAAHRPLSSIAPPSQATPVLLATTKRMPKQILGR